MTQPARVLAALRAHPDRGVSSVDFLSPPTIDGGPPITRLAARIKELKNQGHQIVDAGHKNGCKVYRLEQPVPDGQLFAAPTRNAIYGDAA